MKCWRRSASRGGGRQDAQGCHERALRDWVTNVDSTFYCIGTVAGPILINDGAEFQSIIGRETREQILQAEGRLPDSLIACIGALECDGTFTLPRRHTN